MQENYQRIFTQQPLTGPLEFVIKVQSPQRQERITSTTNYNYVSSSKIEQRLDLQKNSSILQLGESFLGDEGCEALARFLAEHDTFATLDLHGNDISGRGITSLCSYFAKTLTLKQ